MFKREVKESKNFTPLNTHYEHIWYEVILIYNIFTPLAPKANVMGIKSGRWCKFHRFKGHHIEDYYQLKKEFERLIQEEHLKKYMKGEITLEASSPTKKKRHLRV